MRSVIALIVMVSTIVTVPVVATADVVTYLYNFTGATTGAPQPATPAAIPNFSIGNMSIGNANGTVSTPINSTSPSTTYAGASGTNNIGNAFRIGALATGASGSGFLEFTVTNNTNFAASLDDFDFGVRSTGTGPQAFTLATGLSFATTVVTGTIQNDSTWRLINNSFTPVSIAANTSAVFRLYAHGGTGSPSSGTINGRFDDISVTLTAVPEPSAVLFGGLIATIGGLGYAGRRMFARG